jgi:hypothetical protein
MEPTLFEATVTATADDARIHCIGDLNGRADAAMDEAYATAAAAGATRITPPTAATSTAPASPSSSGC